MSVIGNIIIRLLGWVLGWIPWFALVLAAFKRSIFPVWWVDILFGRHESPAGLRGKLKYPIILGACTLYINLVLWAVLIPREILGWESFPTFCVEPRTGWGLLAIHQASWHHSSFVHLGSNGLGLCLLGPPVMRHGRRCFASATLCVSLVGYWLLWLLGPDGICYAGFSLVPFGWLGVALAGELSSMLLPSGEHSAIQAPMPWRVGVACLILAFLGISVHARLIKDDDVPGVSWIGHACGFVSGVVYGYFHFRRGWFLRPGLEDRVRPLQYLDEEEDDDDEDASVCRALVAIVRELLQGFCDGAADLKDALLCKPPAATPPTHAGAPRPHRDAGGAPDVSGAPPWQSPKEAAPRPQAQPPPCGACGPEVIGSAFSGGVPFPEPAPELTVPTVQASWAAHHSAPDGAPAADRNPFDGDEGPLGENPFDADPADAGSSGNASSVRANPFAQEGELTDRAREGAFSSSAAGAGVAAAGWGRPSSASPPSDPPLRRDAAAPTSSQPVFGEHDPSAEEVD